MSQIILPPSVDRELAERAIDDAKRAWNQLLEASGGPGSNPKKFTHNLRVFMDAMTGTNTIGGMLCAQAIKLRVKHTRKTDTVYWT